MSRWPLIALALTGCDQVFDLQAVAPVPNTVIGTLHHRSVANSAEFEPLMLERIPPVEDVTLRAILDDGTESRVDYRDDGTFSFPIAHVGQRYRLISEIDTTLVSELQHDAPVLAIGYFSAGRFVRRPVTATHVTYTYTSLRATHIASTGIYTHTGTAMPGPNVMFDWRTAAVTAAGLPGMLEAAEHDRIHILDFETMPAGSLGATSSWLRVAAVSSSSITQATNSVAMLPAPASVTPNVCMRLVSQNTVEHTRMVAAHPRSYTATRSDWIAFSVPAPSFVGLAGGIYTAIASAAGTADLDITPAWHNPFPGTTIMATTAVVNQFLVQLPGATSTPLSNSTRAYAVAELGIPSACTPAPTSIAPVVGIVGAFELDDVDLTGDNKEVVLDLTRDPTLTWRTLAEGPIELVLVSLLELQNINGVTTLIPRWAAGVVGTSARIDRSMLEAGRTYIFAVTSSLGRPHAATGDLMTLALGFETSTSYSYTFAVRAE